MGGVCYGVLRGRGGGVGGGKRGGGGIDSMMADLQDLGSSLRGAFAEHLQQHAQQLRILHVGSHHHSCALDHLQRQQKQS